MSIAEFIFNNKNKIVYSGLLMGGFYLYKEYLHVKLKFLYDIYSHYSNFSYDKVIKTHVTTKNKESFMILNENLVYEILECIKLRYKSEVLFQKVQNVSFSNEEKIRYWGELKQSLILSNITAILISRVLNLISQTNLIIIERVNRENHQSLSSFFLHKILNELWMMAKDDFIPYLIQFAEQRLCKVINKLSLRDKFSYESVCSIVNEIKRNVFGFHSTDEDSVKVDLMKYYIDTLENKIKSIEKENYSSITDENRADRDFYIDIFGTLYDIFDSNLFNVVLIKLVDEDFRRLNRLIFHLFTDNSEKVAELSVLKLIKKIALLNPRILNKENSVFFDIDKLSENLKSEQEEYFKVIFS